MAEKTPPRRRSAPKKKRRKGKAALSITAAIGIALLLERIGLLSKTAWDKLMAGDIAGLVEHLRTTMVANFTGAGVPVTIAGGVTFAVVAAIIKRVSGGGEMPLRMPRAIKA